MNQLTAMCGMDCGQCPAYIATITNNDEKRKKTAAFWSKLFKKEIKPEEINCDGCLSGSDRIFGHCRKCPVRLSGIEKKVENCAHCSEYPCSNLQELQKILPKTARENLENIRAAIRGV